MKPISDLNLQNKKRSISNKIFVAVLILILVGGSVILINNNTEKPEKKDNYKFVLDGEEMEEIVGCEKIWHYENISGFIPCVINGTVGGLAPNAIDWTISPQENCAFYGGNFTGLNIYNETRAKELYDLLLPKCWTLNQTDISNEWINMSQCVCLDNCGDDCFKGNYTFIKNCESYDCGGGLILNKE